MLVLPLLPVAALLTALGAEVPSRPVEARTQTPAPALAAFPITGACWYTDTWQAPRPGGRVHEGVDIGAAAGTPIVAVAAGTITKMYADRPDFRGGNALRLTMADGTYFFYGHLQGFADGIAIGTAVTAGQVVGFVGHTGNAGVDHLHLEVHPGGGAPINPYPVVKAVNGCTSSGRAAPTPPSTTSAPAPGATAGAPPATTVAQASAKFVASPVGSPGCLSTHVVEAGDYWFLIAARYAVPARLLTAANGRTLQSFIYAGETLCLPATDWVPPATSAAPPASAPPTTMAPAAPPATSAPASATTTSTVTRPKPVPLAQCEEFYTIRTGDYWVMLGQWFQKRASRIAAANGRLLDDPVYPGDVVCIPF